MSEPVEIKWLEKKSSLHQVYQTGLEYSFVDADNNQVCCFVMCKDFLQDAICSMYNKKKISIYGFKYDPEEDRPVYVNKVRIALANSKDKDFRDKIPAILDLLNQLERKMHLIRTTVAPVSNPPKKYEKGGVFLFEGSGRWMLSPPMLSLYTLLLRVGAVHNIGDSYTKTFQRLIDGNVKAYQQEDATQLRDARNGIDRILAYGYAKLFYKEPQKNFPNIDIDTMHNYFGIVSYSRGDTKTRMKYWHRDPEKKPKAPKAKKAEKVEKVAQ